MKKIIYLFSGLFAAMFTTSCKKDYTCECTETYSGSTSAQIYEITIKDVSKKAAKANCVSTEETSGSGFYTYTYSTECELK